MKIENTHFAIGDNPKIGRIYEKSKQSREIRIFPTNGYLVFYREIPNGAYIERIIHGAMDFDLD